MQNKIEEVIAVYGSDEISYTAEPFDIGYYGNDVDKVILDCQAINIDKPVRVVAEWVWCDLVLEEEDSVPVGLFPVILFAGKLVSDPSGRFKVGHRIRTSLLKKLHNDCIFESENTFYILSGKGFRRNIDIEIINYL